MKRPLKHLSLLAMPALVVTGCLTGCVGNADDPGVPTASWLSAPNDGTLDPRHATTDVEPNRPGLSADDVPSQAVAPWEYERFSARGGERGLPHPKKPYEPPQTLPEQRGGEPATVYPTPAQQQQGAGSVSIYPAPGTQHNPNFQRTPTFYPPNTNPGGVPARPR